jgi:glycosyltransferase involved in cell wall biosynthesis
MAPALAKLIRTSEGKYYMKYLMVSTYPPMKCGIGTYAYQMTKKLQASGNIVKVLTPKEGEGDSTSNLRGGFNFLKIARHAMPNNKIIIQYHESFYYADKLKKNCLSVLATHISFYCIFLLFHTKTEVIVHEFPKPNQNKFDYFFEKMKWHLCPLLVFHTKKEVENFEEHYFKLSSKQYELRSPHEYYFKFIDMTPKEARKELGIANNSIVFLCIGFIQPHKGFDRAIEAFNGIANNIMHLYIVGSLRIDWGEYIDHLNKLKQMAEKNPNIHIIETYLSDEDFDTWICASDVVVIPYREIWSSAVLGRAKLFDKPVIASDVGGLSDQLTDNDILFKSDDELEFIIREFSKEITIK